MSDRSEAGWRWFKVPVGLIERLPEVGATAATVYVVLASYADDQGRCWPSVGTLARQTGLTDRAVQKAIARLHGAGLLTRCQRPGHATMYDITPTADAVTIRPPEGVNHGSPRTYVHHTPEPTFTTPPNLRSPRTRTKNKNQEQESARKRAFVPPSLDEVRAYCQQRGNTVDPEAWLAYYQSNGWRVGRNPMKDWQPAGRPDVQPTKIGGQA